MATWVTAVVTAITAVAAIGGVVAGQWMQSRTERDRWEATTKRDDHTALRAAATELMEAGAQVDLRVRRAVHIKQPIASDEELLKRFLAAQVKVQVLVGNDTWAEMQPYITALSVRHNAVLEGDPAWRAQAEARAKALGLTAPDAMRRQEQQFITAARKALGLAD